jgi:hypothetical protein
VLIISHHSQAQMMVSFLHILRRNQASYDMINNMRSIQARKEAKQLSLAIVKQMLILATGGFSLVSALAWNDAIRGFIDQYIKPYATKGSGLIAQIIYAIVITMIAVFVTYQLGRAQQALEQPEEKEMKKKKK